MRLYLSAEQSSTELATGTEEIEVVATREVLRHCDNGSVERSFSVVIGRVLRHVTRQLRNLIIGVDANICM